MNIPEELILESLLKLDFKDIGNVCRTNRKVANVCKQNRNYIYNRFLERDFGKWITDPRKLYIAIEYGLFDALINNYYIKLLENENFINYLHLYFTGNEQDGNGFTLLMTALYKINGITNETLINKILDLGPDMDIVNDEHISTALIYALENNNLSQELLFRIMDMSDVNFKFDVIGTPLTFALRGEASETAILRLLDLGADVNFTDEETETPLTYALVTSASTERIMLKILDLKPVDIDTALMIALENPSGIVTERVMLKILDLKPNMDVIDNQSGDTALMIALKNPSGIVTERVMLKILEFDQKLNMRNMEQQTALTIALQNQVPNGTVTTTVTKTIKSKLRRASNNEHW
jgi:ankyrin repeat protein